MTRLFHNLFLRDWLLKLFSFALAFLTWLAVSFSLRQTAVEVPGKPTQMQKTFYDLPVLIMSTGADVSAFKVRPTEVDITVQGEESALKNLQGRNIRVLADLTGIEATPGTAVRLPVEVIVPAGIIHTHIQPDEVDVIRPEPAPQNGTQ